MNDNARFLIVNSTFKVIFKNTFTLKKFRGRGLKEEELFMHLKILFLH